MARRRLRARCKYISPRGAACSTLVPLANYLRYPRDGDSPHYCAAHEATVLARKSAYMAHTNVSSPILYSRFILPHLEKRSQLVLRNLMAQPPRDSDIQGFIYALELADYSRPDLIRIKVGRSNDVFSRFRDHCRRCPSRSPKLLGYYPSGVAAITTPYVKYSDGLERLVHIELTDRSAKSYPTGRNAPLSKCYDCGSRHREIFTFKRLQGRDYGKEWDLLILPVIERWAAYIAMLR